MADRRAARPLRIAAKQSCFAIKLRKAVIRSLQRKSEPASAIV